jgi:hyaluronoglucosaminidase
VLHQEYPDALLAFVPNDYWSGSSGATTDLVYVGAHLDPMWAIAWTGPQVSSPTIADADADAIAVTLQRKPFLADNHPVVAPPAQTGVVDLGALEGRSPTLADHVLGVVYNPMPLARASLPGLATAADYAWNSAAYDPDRSLATAAAWLAGGTAADAFLTLCRADLSPVFHPEQAPDAAAAVNAFLAPGADLATLSTALRTLLVAFSAVPAALAADAAATPGLTDEVKPWSDKLGAYGDAGQIAVDLLLAQAAGQPVDATRLADLHARAAALTAQNAKPTGTVMSGFLATALARLDGGDAADP